MPRTPQYKCLYQEFTQTSGSPLTKLRATKATNAKANCKNCGQTVVFDLACDLSYSFDSNYSEIPNSCLSDQFAFVVNPFQMFIYGWNRNLKQLCHIGLCKPNSLVFKSALNARSTILGLVEEEFGLRQWFVGHWGLSFMFQSGSSPVTQCFISGPSRGILPGKKRP